MGAGPTRRTLLASAGATAAGLALARSSPVRAEAAAAVVDIHCHTFCAADLPIVGFLAHQIPGLMSLSRIIGRWPEIVVRALLRAVTTLPNTTAPSGAVELAQLRALAAQPGPPLPSVPPLPPGALDDLLESATKHLPFRLPSEQRRAAARALEALYLVGHARAAITSTLVRTYPGVELFTPALVDYDAWSDDQASTPLWQQVLIQESISRLSVMGRVGRPEVRIHPFVAFDPRRQATAAPAHESVKTVANEVTPAPPGPASTALELVKYAVGSAGFVGVKLYPPVGFAPFDNARLQPELAFAAELDAALSDLYELCAADEIPIMTHASPGNAYSPGLRPLVSPARWRPVLERFPSLRLNLGHFGGDSRAWMDEAAVLMNRYPNVYADLSSSNFVHDEGYAVRIGSALADLFARYPKLKRRVMYGGDWWLSALEPAAPRTLERFRAVVGDLLTLDERQGAVGRNALRFLGLIDDDDGPRSGAAARRLRTFYGSRPAPSWMRA